MSEWVFIIISVLAALAAAYALSEMIMIGRRKR